jgi:uncharacterized iron-regulated protein
MRKLHALKRLVAQLLPGPLWAVLGLPFLLGLGCQAHTGPRPGAPPTASAPAPAQPAGELLLRDGKTAAPLSPEELTERLRAARAIYVGERHNNRASHEAQLKVLERVYAIDQDVALAIEMLPRTLQPQLDAYLAGSVDEAGFLAAVDWQHTWGFDFALYRPLFEFCRTHGLRIYALNAPREVVRAVRQRGIDGLSATERAELPTGYPWPAPEEHRRAIQEVFARHSFGDEDKRTPAERVAAFERFYLAQLVWDETMAQGVTAILSAKNPPKRVVVLAGGGHVGRFAIPARASRRGLTQGLALAPVDETPEEPAAEADAVDIQIVLPKSPKS